MVYGTVSSSDRKKISFFSHGYGKLIKKTLEKYETRKYCVNDSNIEC